MGTYLIRRIFQMILMFLSSQDLQQITQEQLDFLRHDLGLDRPMVVQYFDWLGDVLHGDLGTSVVNRTKIITDVVRRLPITFELGIIAFVLSIVIGIPIGVIAAVKRGTWVDNTLTALANLGICLPSFWLGILLIYIVSFKANMLPMFGFVSLFDNPLGNLTHIIMPVICLGLAPIATGVRITRSSMLEVLRQDYIRTAWSKGLKQQSIIVKHALKNGLIPVITMKGMTLAAIVGGSVIIETVFSIPGMGRLSVEGLFAQDYTIVQACLLIGGSVTLLANLLVDLSYGWLDPRIRYR
jgi:peptide/nickel transport system permease protein